MTEREPPLPFQSRASGLSGEGRRRLAVRMASDWAAVERAAADLSGEPRRIPSAGRPARWEHRDEEVGSSVSFFLFDRDKGRSRTTLKTADGRLLVDLCALIRGRGKLHSTFHRYYVFYKAYDLFEDVPDRDLALVFEALNKHGIIVSGHPVSRLLLDKALKRFSRSEAAVGGDAFKQLVIFFGSCQVPLQQDQPEQVEMWAQVCRKIAGEALMSPWIGLQWAALGHQLPSNMVAPEVVQMVRDLTRWSRGKSVDSRIQSVAPIASMCHNARAEWLEEADKKGLALLLIDWQKKNLKQPTCSVSSVLESYSKLAMQGNWDNDLTAQLLRHPNLVTRLSDDIYQLRPHIMYRQCTSRLKSSACMRVLSCLATTLHHQEYRGPLLQSFSFQWLSQDSWSKRKGSEESQAWEEDEEGSAEEFWGHISLPFITTIAVQAMEGSLNPCQFRIRRILPQLGFFDMVFAVNGEREIVALPQEEAQTVDDDLNAVHERCSRSFPPQIGDDLVTWHSMVCIDSVYFGRLLGGNFHVGSINGFVSLLEKIYADLDIRPHFIDTSFIKHSDGNPIVLVKEIVRQVIEKESCLKVTQLKTEKASS